MRALKKQNSIPVGCGPSTCTIYVLQWPQPAAVRRGGTRFDAQFGNQMSVVGGRSDIQGGYPTGPFLARGEGVTRPCDISNDVFDVTYLPTRSEHTEACENITFMQLRCKLVH